MADSTVATGGDGKGLVDISALIPEELFFDLRMIGVVSL